MLQAISRSHENAWFHRVACAHRFNFRYSPKHAGKSIALRLTLADNRNDEHTASAPTGTSAAGLRHFVAEKQTQAGEQIRDVRVFAANSRHPRSCCVRRAQRREQEGECALGRIGFQIRLHLGDRAGGAIRSQVNDRYG